MNTDTCTWAASHPEVVAASRNLVPWSCEQISTDLGPCSQPTLSLGPNDELVADGLRKCEVEDPGSRGDQTALLYRSADGGRTWTTLCELPMPVAAPLSAGVTFGPRPGGVGFLRDGTLLASIRLYYRDGGGSDGPEDTSVHSRVWVTRSADRGRTWDAPVELDPAPFEAMGGNRVRFHECPDGTVLLPMNCTRCARPGRPLQDQDRYETAQIYGSTDAGRTWTGIGDVGKHSDETDLLSLPSGRILAATRYQRRCMPGDPPGLGRPEDGSKKGSVYKNTAVCWSDDGGRSFSAHRLVTGWLQQTACLVRLGDGAVLMPFGHKDETQGQRFMISLDDGRTWAKVVYELNRSGMYASSVVLGDGTIVTVYAVEWHSEGRNRLAALRWTPPSREQVRQHGFFTPRPAAS